MSLKNIALICSIVISWTMVAQQSFADIKLDKSEILFGGVPMRTVSIQTFKVYNNGYETVIVDATKYCPAEFDIERKRFVVYPGESRVIKASFTPTTPYFKYCNISVRDSDGSGSYITLSGRGI